MPGPLRHAQLAQASESVSSAKCQPEPAESRPPRHNLNLKPTQTAPVQLFDLGCGPAAGVGLRKILITSKLAAGPGFSTAVEERRESETVRLVNAGPPGPLRILPRSEEMHCRSLSISNHVRCAHRKPQGYENKDGALESMKLTISVT